jgi:subtilisin family serine protease
MVHVAASTNRLASALALFLVFATAGPPATASGAPFWIFFRDRGALSRRGPARDAALQEVAKRVTPRALARRARAAREIKAATTSDELDLPPDPAYVAAVGARCESIRTRSSWLNAVSVEAAPESLALIKSLPFVADIRPVALETMDEAATPPATHDGAATLLGDAGPSNFQTDMIRVPEVHAMGDHGEGVVVCVLDSGFELDHESLRQLEVRGQRDFVNGDDDPSYDPRTDLPTQSNHGTAVLSTIAGYAPGKLIGPAFRAEYLLGKTERIGSEMQVEEDYWCAGVEWAEAEGADILTSSLTYHNWYRWRDLDGRTAVATRAANLALTRGLLIVNAIGNEGPKEGSIGAPADAPAAVSVGAVNSAGVLAGFSSVGPTYDRRVKPDVVAPGVGVITAVARTYDRYTPLSGTSLAAPLVAGCAALVLSAHPDWGPEMLRDAIAMSASRAERPDNQYGWGIVNARDAVLYPLIEGKVTDSTTREAIGGATVRWRAEVGAERAVERDSTGAEGAVEADSTGAYVIPNLPRGSYTITVTKAGYIDASAGPYKVPPNLGDVNLELQYQGMRIPPEK